MDVSKLEKQDNMIYRFFRLTTEPYDDLEWDGKTLEVVLNNKTIETYSYEDLCEIIEDFD